MHTAINPEENGISVGRWVSTIKILGNLPLMWQTGGEKADNENGKEENL